MEMRKSSSTNYMLLVLGVLTLCFVLYFGSFALTYSPAPVHLIVILGFLVLNGFFMVYTGYSGLTKPIWFIESEVIYVKNHFGHKFIKQSFDSYKDLLVEDKKLFVIRNGEKILIVKKQQCHSQDWELMVKTLLQRQNLAVG
jgi:hypothetical protein